jgi:hypothetical protein
VAGTARDTITLDLPGLVSASGPESQAAISGVDLGHSVKVTVRLAPHIARRLTTQARAAGLSHGVYLSTLIAGAPAVLTSAEHRRAVAALTSSNDEMARLATDLHSLARLLRREAVPSAGEVEATVEALSCEVRAHLRHASRLMADLAPLAATSRAQSAEEASSGRVAR